MHDASPRTAPKKSGLPRPLFVPQRRHPLAVHRRCPPWAGPLPRPPGRAGDESPRPVSGGPGPLRTPARGEVKPDLCQYTGWALGQARYHVCDSWPEFEHSATASCCNGPMRCRKRTRGHPALRSFVRILFASRRPEPTGPGEVHLFRRISAADIHWPTRGKPGGRSPRPAQATTLYHLADYRKRLRPVNQKIRRSPPPLAGSVRPRAQPRPPPAPPPGERPGNRAANPYNRTRPTRPRGGGRTGRRP